MEPGLRKPIALVGFMGAGKDWIAGEVVNRLGGVLVHSDSKIEDMTGKTIPEIFDERGEEGFRELERSFIPQLLQRGYPDLVLSVGGGAVTVPEIRDALQRYAFTVWVDTDVETCWERAKGSDRPLAQDETAFRKRFQERQPLYREVADAIARDADDVVLAAAGIHFERGALQRLGELVPGDGPVALVSDPRVMGIHGAEAQLALGERLVSTHELPEGEEAKTIEPVNGLWNELTLKRDGTLVALGGGCTTDAAGFAAATYLRGIPWVSVPTSLVGQVDAGIGGKTAIDLSAGKNLVGAFHWPTRTIIDPALLATLPERERKEGMAEVVKTGLLAGEPLWELPEDEIVRRCAAFKAAVCLRDPYEQGERAILNLGHTFAHALEAAAGYESVTHGQAVALGLTAALRLSGRDTSVVEKLLDPKPVRVDRNRAWAALGRDKKSGLVLLSDDGPVRDVRLPEADVRAALDALIAG